MINKKQAVGTLAALLANVIFGFSFIFSKAALAVANPLIILAVRFTVAFAVLNILLLTGKVKLSLKGKPKLRLIAMAMSQPLLYFIFELYGLSLVSSALSGVIIALVPVAVMLLAVFFLKERPTFMQIICTILSLVGISVISIISNDGTKNHFLGIILLFLAVICSAVFNILSRHEAQSYSAFERTYMMFLIGTIGFNLIAIATLRAGYFTEITKAFSAPEFITAIIYLAGFSSVGAFLLYNYSTSVISAVRSSSFSSVITVVTVSAGVLILKESFSWYEYLVCAIIIFGVWGVNFFVSKNIS